MENANKRKISKTTKSKNNYRILRVEKKLVKPGLFKKPYVTTEKITMVKFYAKDDDDARAFLKEYKKAANREYDYYFESYSPVCVIGDDGKCREYEDHFAYWADDKAKTFILKRIWDAITFELWYWFIDRPNHVRYWVRDLIYWMRTRHDYRESWSLDMHVLDDLIWNIPILIKNKHGLAGPFLDKAVKETHKKEKNFDIKEWNKTHYEYTDEEEKLAEKYQNEEFGRLVEYVKLYKYYLDSGVVDETNEEEVAFGNKWRYTLPIIEGTYDSFDYEKLQALTNRYWNKIWDWMRLFGQTLWD